MSTRAGKYGVVVTHPLLGRLTTCVEILVLLFPSYVKLGKLDSLFSEFQPNSTIFVGLQRLNSSRTGKEFRTD